MRFIRSAAIFLTFALGANAADRSIHITGRPQVIITTSDIRLADIAEVSSLHVEDDEAVIGLQKIWIGRSPRPASNVTISAGQILERLSHEGVALTSVAYTLPRIITVQRAGRLLTQQEIQGAVNQYIHDTQSDMTVQQIEYQQEQGVPPGQVELTVDSAVPTGQGKFAFLIHSHIDGQDGVQFTVSVDVDQYKQVPVAKRGVAKGSVITEADVYFARLNTALLPQDAVEDSHTILGLEATNEIHTGEVFRNTKLALPQIIAAGAKVTMQFKGELFEATATGVALESGVAGQDIRVRNEMSKKIITGHVIEQGLVSVQ